MIAHYQNTTPAKLRQRLGSQGLENYQFLLLRDKAVRETLAELLGEDTASENTSEDTGDNTEDTTNTSENTEITADTTKILLMLLKRLKRNLSQQIPKTKPNQRNVTRCCEYTANVVQLAICFYRQTHAKHQACCVR